MRELIHLICIVPSTMKRIETPPEEAEVNIQGGARSLPYFKNS